jgi:hypothetical protein
MVVMHLKVIGRPAGIKDLKAVFDIHRFLYPCTGYGKGSVS